MIREEEVFKIGRIGKPHGVNGEVFFYFDDDVFDRVEAEFLVLRVDGILVPFYMDEYRFRSDTTALVSFCDIDTVEKASSLTGSEVYFLRSLAEEDDRPPTLQSLVGLDVTDAGSGVTVGTIARVDDSTANILFELEDGRLIPANDQLIETIDMKGKKIVMNIPEGLLDI